MFLFTNILQLLIYKYFISLFLFIYLLTYWWSGIVKNKLNYDTKRTSPTTITVKHHWLYNTPAKLSAIYANHSKILREHNDSKLTICFHPTSDMSQDGAEHPLTSVLTLRVKMKGDYTTNVCPSVCSMPLARNSALYRYGYYRTI